MDPTMPPMPGQQQPPGNPALQNALMLQAIKGGASGGAAPPMGATSMATGQQQMPIMGAGIAQQQMPPPAPTNPASMPGGLNAPATPPLGMQMPMMQGMGGQGMSGQAPDPTMAALFSQIPGGS